jgi:hypothetical protein
MPWSIVKVGCETHHIDYWKEHWQAIAQKHNVTLNAEAVKQLLSGGGA